MNPLVDEYAHSVALLERAEQLLEQAQDEVRERYFRYQQLAAMDWEAPDAAPAKPTGEEKS